MTKLLTALDDRELDALVRELRICGRRRGRPWALPLRQRVSIGCASLRTNLTARELAAMFAISRSQAHRIVADITARIAHVLTRRACHDRR